MIHFENVSKSYPSSKGGVRNLSLHICAGEFVYIIGESGAGKSTLINLLIKNIDPDAGKIRLSHLDLSEILPEELAHYRRNFGIISPKVGMLMDQTVSQNVALPLRVRGEKAWVVREAVDSMLGSVGIKEIANKKSKAYFGWRVGEGCDRSCTDYQSASDSRGRTDGGARQRHCVGHHQFARAF